MFVETAQKTATEAPYWFGAVLGVAGIVLGVLIKALIDSLTSWTRNKREDRLRFVADKRAAYADLITACEEVADAEHESRLLIRRGRGLKAQTRTHESEWDDYERDFQKMEHARAGAFREVNRAAAIVDVLAPANVVEAASLYLSRCQHPHLLPRRVEAQKAFIDAARADLGHPPVGHTTSYSFEDYISTDDPESGLDDE